MTFKERTDLYRQAVEEYLRGCFADDSFAQRELFHAMRYSLLAGGKHLRAILALEFCRVCGGDWQKALPFACAVEMVHTYSLIHDDLPCMDNDDYRRGRLTNHKVYGEAMATLAGDGLLTAAFDCLSHAEAEPEICLRAVQILSRAAGELGMVGGQVLDLEGEGKHLDAEGVLAIHRLKTGCLISAPCRIGVTAAHGSEEQMQAAAEYAEALGLAFQMRDDILDVIGDAAKLGKATGMDENKSTFVSLYGVDRCQQMVEEQTDRAIAALLVFTDSEYLAELASSMRRRDH